MITYSIDVKIDSKTLEKSFMDASEEIASNAGKSAKYIKQVVAAGKELARDYNHAPLKDHGLRSKVWYVAEGEEGIIVLSVNDGKANLRFMFTEEIQS